MKKIKTSEIILILIVLAPFVYLAKIWNELPERVPMHWNIEGKIDRYGSKTELIWIPVLLPLLTYLLITFVPKIDPKNQLAKMGKKIRGIEISIGFIYEYIGRWNYLRFQNRRIFSS